MILAIDPSLSNTAIIRGDAREYELNTFSSKPCGDGVVSRMARFEDMIDRMTTLLSDRTHYDAIYIEGYSLGHARPGISQITEFGGLLRWHLIELSERIYEVPPMTLKKFCAGTGAAKKDMVAAHLTRRWNVMFKSNDEFDAFGLYRLGLVAEGFAEPDNQAQRESVDKVLGVVRPKAKKPKKADQSLWST